MEQVFTSHDNPITHDLSYYRNKKVLVTGHNGFKGSWLTFWLNKLGAEVYGYSLTPAPAELEESLCHIINLKQDLAGEKLADIRWYDTLQNYFHEVQPDVVFHLAAQPIVSEGYKYPQQTFETNVMGTVNVMECIRKTPSVRSAVIITTDKVYDYNYCPADGYREGDPLGGFDPYSNSKSCADLAAQCYYNSFFDKEERRISFTIFRAGNVIGGGDFAKNRIVPDFYRAMRKGETLQLRNPGSVRPYQHVLEPLYAYLRAGVPTRDVESGIYNVGPREYDCATTEQLVNALAGGECCFDYSPSDMVESEVLMLNTERIRREGWEPRWNLAATAEKVSDWYLAYLNNPSDVEGIRLLMHKQIDEYYAKVVLGWSAE